MKETYSHALRPSSTKRLGEMRGDALVFSLASYLLS